MNEFSKVIGHEIQHTQISCVSVLAMDDLERQKTVPLSIAFKITQYLGIHLTGEVKRLVFWKTTKIAERNERRPT